MTQKYLKRYFSRKGSFKKLLGLDWISRLEAHHRLGISISITSVMLLLLHNKLELPTLIIITWVTYAITVLFLAWVAILKAHPRHIRYIARIQDTGRQLIFVFVIVATVASVLSVLILLKSIQGLSKEEVNQHILLSIASVVCSWLLVHTIFTLRYAHLYYSTNATAVIPRGLEFPSENNPDYLDFAYFSFVIGMTCQVSDVQITSRSIRRLALVHGIITFAFNTIVVALTINIVSGLLER